MKQFSKRITGIIVAISIAGCATIMGDSSQTIPIASTPSGATISITDERGSEIFKGQTPSIVTLKKSDGSYWGKKTYIISVSKTGFGTQTIPVQASANGWYIAGNIVFGGLIGWFVVDPLNGSMYNLTPESISASLPTNQTNGNKMKTDGISVMLIEDVPPELKSKMVQIK